MTASDRPLFLTSALLEQAGVVHGFTLRVGGVSQGPYATLNLAPGFGDRPEHVAANRRRLAAAAGFDDQRLATLRQVHGAEVAIAESMPAGAPPPAADALVSRRPGTTVGVFTADCLPLLLVDPRQRRVAAAHAGWRGTLAGVATAVVEAMIRLGSSPDDLRAAIGPAIGSCCFAVGDNVAAAFRAAFPGQAVVPEAAGHQAHVDLRLANRLRLLAAGLALEHIDDAFPCTCCDPQRFFSYRRQRGPVGEHLAFIGLASRR
jgi:YfiH family protein